MPCYFNQTRYKSFQRQLNSYRFHRFVSGKNKGTCFHELFMRGKPDLCTRINRMKVTRGRPSSAQQQTLLLEDHEESSEADDPENCLRMFNSEEVDPLDCPSVNIFDDEEEDIQLGRTTSATAPALQQGNMGESGEFQDKFYVEPQKTSSNATLPQYVLQHLGRNKTSDYSFFCGTSNEDDSNNNFPWSLTL